MSLLDLAEACDVADIARLETLPTDNGTLVGVRRVAEANMVRARRADISQFYEIKAKRWSWKNI